MRSFLHPCKQSWVGVSPFPLLFLPWKLRKVGRLGGQFEEEKAWSQRGGGERQRVPRCDRAVERRSQWRRGSACRVCSEGLQTLCSGDRNASVWGWRQLEVGAQSRGWASENIWLSWSLPNECKPGLLLGVGQGQVCWAGWVLTLCSLSASYCHCIPFGSRGFGELVFWWVLEHVFQEQMQDVKYSYWVSLSTL